MERDESGETGAVAPAQAGERSKSRRLVDRVYDMLTTRIRNGEFAPDSKLPGEHDLAAMFGVSRPIVRDALGRLREEGVIHSRQGAGSFVRAHKSNAPSTLGFAPVETIADIQRCYEFRMTIEPDAAFYAARRRDDEALARILDALNQLQDATRHRLHREDADFSFHKAITEASNNHYYLSSIEALRQHISVGMHLHGLSLMGPRLQLEKVFEEHKAIYDAILEERPGDARDAMRRHLEGSRDRLFEGRILDLSL
ncbi:FadR/GntR family transcriptional regulator [Methylobrevis pamukkalensis]|uniref:HTH-type transcriptional regulator LutR n=1 Tax=Methylobrevis pamukkalensis TaxID=1439726 RepID=A0A1E3H4D4_9HYPH|nr:FadR/GntR family transcriptional regulator [Methylobrevis pamukkalensis]ODN71015.1 HTH-type transcriptional regulator LutR [Methylobrevis pamukkalensis]